MPLIKLQTPFSTSPLKWVLVDHLGLPRYWATVWSFYRLADLAPSTAEKYLRYLDTLYQYSDEINHRSTLDDAIGTIDIQHLGSVLEGYFISLQSAGFNRTSYLKWQTAFQFIKDTIFGICKSDHGLGVLIEVEARVRHLEMMYSQLRIGQKKTQEPIRALPASVINYLYDTLDPASLSNPFSSTTSKWRAYALFIVLLHQGLRRGEALCLAADSVRTDFDTDKRKNVHWLKIENNRYEEDDTRYTRPDIKNTHSYRKIPVNDLTANVLFEYIDNYRGCPNHSFLFNSQKNKPLSTESVSLIFRIISDALPDYVVQELDLHNGKRTISPHDLRYTCAVFRLSQILANGIQMDVALQQLRGFFGWSRTSDMPRKYAKTVFDDRLAKLWDKMFDNRVEVLRSIPDAL